MRHRAHAETPYYVVFVQLLMFLPPITWWYGHGRPPVWTMWLACQLSPALFLIGFFTLGFIGDWLEGLWRNYRKHKKNQH